MLIASNHPNSFLDAIIVATLFKRPVYSLARGDVFASKFYDRLLRALNILPVYRISEGVENLEHNYKTFEDCKTLFDRKGIVLIFSEGKCINEWHLRPLKKGTARLAIDSWQNNIPLQVLPLGINYSSFHTFGKNMQLNFGSLITKEQVAIDGAHGKSLVTFNRLLQEQLQQGVIEIEPGNKQEVIRRFVVLLSPLKKMLLTLPALAGWLLHAPLYIPIKNFAWKRAGHNDHFDSVTIGLLFILYPFYLLLIASLLFFITGSWYAWLVFMVLPFCAWSYVQVKHQFDRVRN